MQSAIEQFRANIQRVHALGSIYQALNAQTTEALDLSDLLRSEWVMAVSALDHYVHELVKLGMLEIYRGYRPQTDAFSQFQITLGSALQAVNSPGNHEWLEDQIRARHSHLSFQTPDNIANAIRLISPESLWSEVAAKVTQDSARYQRTIEPNRQSPESKIAGIKSPTNQIWIQLISIPDGRSTIIRLMMQLLS